MKFVVIMLLCSMHYSLFASDDDQIKAGKDALEKGDFTKAIELLRDATKKEKKNPEGFILLAMAYLRLDSAEQAIGPLTQAKDIDSNNVMAYELTGDAYSKQKIYAAAIEQYKKATELAGKRIDLFLKLAESYKKNRLYTEAARTLQQAIALDTVNLPALRELSTLLMRAKQYVSAVPVLERLTRLQPDSLSYSILYVKSLSETKRYALLIPVAEKVLAKDPSQADVKKMLLEGYRETKNFGKGGELLTGVNPDSLSVDALLDGAVTFKQLEQWDKAIDFYSRAWKKDSTRCDIPYDFGTTYMKVKRWDDAVAMFERKITCDTTAGYRFASHLNIAMSLMQEKEFKTAKAHIQSAIEFRPDNVQAWLTLAQDLGQLDQLTEEVAAYKKVIELATAPATNGEEGKYASQLCEAYRMLGVRYLIEATKDKEPKKEKYGAALEYLLKALQCSPKDCALLLWTAQAYQNSNKKEEAKKYYHKVLEICPKAKEADDAKKGLTALGEK